ncbi:MULTISPECIES: 50S ribosomal protein L23 [unclassified Haematospirillum]|uniref:50S ribosomal protein L23 n=1 Tax=unclassified Haematospirillum TaxID=2622088 RepID=UPI00143B6EC6|nr:MULTISPECIES: 50S ribosomal protein L23 [unclassified Haematospirillum]NKD54987.1 50S ribosomal protein L23 [Haematospirillum sp. H4890]NKD75008.1 50S ribosomal protein L23 [Haematospirillum sp. H4485]
MKCRAVKVSKERMYDIIKSPVITEKATMAFEYGQVTFRVPLDASKPEIKASVEGVFGVKVRAVNVSITKGKLKRFRGTIGRRSDVKKAMVRLVEGQSIDVMTGV